MSHRQVKAAAIQLGRLKTQMDAAMERYSPSHPEVRMKAAEIAAVGQRLQTLREGAVPVVPIHETMDWEGRESRHIQTQIQALNAERLRLVAQLEQFAPISDEVARLEATIEKLMTAKPLMCVLLARTSNPRALPPAPMPLRCTSGASTQPV